MTALLQAWMLVSPGRGVVVMAAPAPTRHGAWKAARRELGALHTLQLRRAGYTAQRVSITIGEESWITQRVES